MDVGTGAVGSVVMNDRGDTSVTTGRYASAGGSPPPAFDVKTAFRPAGGTFGVPVTVPGNAAYQAALTATGVALFPGTTVDGGVDFYARVQDGPVSGPQHVALPGAVFQIVTDGTGRALAISPSDGEFVTTTFDGTSWGAPVRYTLPALQNHFEAAADAAGDVVIAWRDALDAGFGNTATVRAMTGTMSGGLSAPVALDDALGYTGPSVGSAPDGTFVIAYDDQPHQAVHVVRSTSPGAFTMPQVAACGENARVAGLDADDNAVLQIGTTELHDAFSTAAVADPICHVPETGSTGPRPSYSQSPIVVGEPVTIDDSGIRRADYDLNGCTFDFGAVVEQRYVPVIDHTFRTPGRNRFTVACNLRSRADGSADSGFDVYTPDVFARADVRVVDVRARTLLLAANAFTGAARRRVTLTVRAHGRTLARERRYLGARLSRVSIPVDRHRLGGRARVILRQSGRLRAVATVRAGRRAAHRAG